MFFSDVQKICSNQVTFIVFPQNSGDDKGKKAEGKSKKAAGERKRKASDAGPRSPPKKSREQSPRKRGRPPKEDKVRCKYTQLGYKTPDSFTAAAVVWSLQREGAFQILIIKNTLPSPLYCGWGHRGQSMTLVTKYPFYTEGEKKIPGYYRVGLRSKRVPKK